MKQAEELILTILNDPFEVHPVEGIDIHNLSRLLWQKYPIASEVNTVAKVRKAVKNLGHQGRLKWHYIRDDLKRIIAVKPLSGEPVSQLYRQVYHLVRDPSKVDPRIGVNQYQLKTLLKAIGTEASNQDVEGCLYSLRELGRLDVLELDVYEHTEYFARPLASCHDTGIVEVHGVSALLPVTPSGIAAGDSQHESRDVNSVVACRDSGEYGTLCQEASCPSQNIPARRRESHTTDNRAYSADGYRHDGDGY